MKTLSKCFLLFSLLFHATSFADTIESKMTQKVQERSGLSKLTKEELDYLNRWLKENYSIDIDNDVESSELLRTIQGDFVGWSGKTVFKMENGEVWQQRIGGKYYKKLSSPDVIITKNIFSLYVMEVVETGRKVGVKKVK